MADMTISTPAGELPVYVATPTRPEPWPAVVVIHDASGVAFIYRHFADPLVYRYLFDEDPVTQVAQAAEIVAFYTKEHQSMHTDIDDRLQQLLNKEIRKPHSHNVLLAVQSADGRVDFRGAAGTASPDSPYFLASVTKMYTVAVLLRLLEAGQLDLAAPLTSYLPTVLLDGIHVYKGVDYSRQLKVYQLVHQTSGLADYFTGKPRGGRSLEADLKQGNDRAYKLVDVLDMARSVPPQFAPDSEQGRISHYSDTNYQLLSAIIEEVSGRSLAENYQHHICEPLSLTQTYLYDSAAPHDTPPRPLYNKARPTPIPLALSSERGAGGLVSTTAECLRFLRAYFGGDLFAQSRLAQLFRWNRLFFPMQYGYGLMRFQLPRFMTLFRETPALIGHSGSSGSFAFLAPQEKLYMAGSFNQFDKPARPFAFMLNIAAAAGAGANR
jgi:CubicO group peptidase (beta-lactamase class C family)